MRTLKDMHPQCLAGQCCARREVCSSTSYEQDWCSNGAGLAWEMGRMDGTAPVDGNPCCPMGVHGTRFLYYAACSKRIFGKREHMEQGSIPKRHSRPVLFLHLSIIAVLTLSIHRGIDTELHPRRENCEPPGISYGFPDAPWRAPTPAHA
jgi:hypothetical protein